METVGAPGLLECEKKMDKKKLWLALTATGCMGILALLCVLHVIHPNALFLPSGALRGVDVSEYQGSIDWRTLASQDVDFAYIKATEGSGSVDPRFGENWAGAAEAGVKVGAYHFFSFDSPAQTQAANFIAAVPATEGMLPPVIDVELYGAYKRAPKPRDEVVGEIRALSDALEARYGVRPTLYVTRRSYALYVRGAGLENALWVRDVFLPPLWAEDWLIWQYADRGELAGYDGPERYIDLNVMRR